MTGPCAPGICWCWGGGIQSPSQVIFILFALLVPEQNSPNLPTNFAQRGGIKVQRFRSGLSRNSPCLCRCKPECSELCSCPGECWTLQAPVWRKRSVVLSGGCKNNSNHLAGLLWPLALRSVGLCREKRCWAAATERWVLAAHGLQGCGAAQVSHLQRCTARCAFPAPGNHCLAAGEHFLRHPCVAQGACSVLGGAGGPCLPPQRRWGTARPPWALLPPCKPQGRAGESTWVWVWLLK